MVRAKKNKTIGELDPSLKDDPRVRDPALLNRMKLLVEQEALHPAWGYPLGVMWRMGKISTAEKMAGDEYERLCMERRKVDEIDLDEVIPEMFDRYLRYIERVKNTSMDVYNAITKRDDGVYIKRALDTLCVGQEYPVNRLFAYQGLRILRDFFGT